VIFSAMTNAVAFKVSRHVKHGEDDGAHTDVHDGGRRAVSAGPDGTATSCQNGFAAEIALVPEATE
jgi:hypothetical protein